MTSSDHLGEPLFLLLRPSHAVHYFLFERFLKLQNLASWFTTFFFSFAEVFPQNHQQTQDHPDLGLRAQAGLITGSHGIIVLLQFVFEKGQLVLQILLSTAGPHHCWLLAWAGCDMGLGIWSCGSLGTDT